ncbi:hypothetical protein B7L70_04490 [Vulcanisaeta sp. EB80]|nr:hypothetical protein B7L70_04490 [Vulcanisaeta sp. EB80]
MTGALWIRVTRDGIEYNFSHPIIKLLSINDDFDVIDTIIKMFNNAYPRGVPMIRSIWIYGRAIYRHTYGHVMYVKRYNSVSIHISSGRIRRDFGKCSPYWGWQVLGHEIAHLVGVGGGHYLSHGSVHLSVTRELLMESLPLSVSIPSIYYLLIDYLLSGCKRGYSRVRTDSVLYELRNVITNYDVDTNYYLGCSRRLVSVLRSCGILPM